MLRVILYRPATPLPQPLRTLGEKPTARSPRGEVLLHTAQLAFGKFAEFDSMQG